MQVPNRLFRPLNTEKLLTVKKIPKRLLSPRTERSYGEAGVYLASGCFGPNNFKNLVKIANLMA
jgi:hypothetical protein